MEHGVAGRSRAQLHRTQSLKQAKDAPRRPALKRVHSLSSEPQLPILLPNGRAASPPSADDPNNNDHLDRLASREGSSGTETDSDSSPPSEGSGRVRLLRKMNSEDPPPLKDRAGSFSATSVSSDSAVGASDSSAANRLQELESELMETKCELAKALNREAAYKTIIEEKILLVNELEERLRAADDPEGDALWKSPVQKGGVSLQEKCRILQNHNRFLNEEVIKLARLMQHEKRAHDRRHQQMKALEAEVDQLKRDYVFLMQSSLRITNYDGPETIEVYLYGGNTHKERVLQLLEEARKINPTLPVFENMSRGLCHVDALGFRRSCGEEPQLLHFLCRQLHHHYSTLREQPHAQRWKRYLRQNGKLSTSKELKSLVRAGIPLHLRSRVWAALYKTRVADLVESKGPHYYNYLCSLAPDDERVSQHKRQIALDLLRTMPDNIRFSDLNADGVRKMQEVLQAFCVHNPSLGYCQGMNFLVGMSLLFLEPEDAFWCLVAVTERYFTAGYFDGCLAGAQADQQVLKELVGERMPRLAHHLAALDIELATVTLNWFLAVFFDCVPFETLLRIWDCFLLEGPKVLFRFSLAILKMSEGALLARTDTVSIMRQLKAAARLCYDVDFLFKTAFEDLKPFTRRQDIATKQACYYKTLKEHAKKLDLERVALHDRERMLSEMELFSVNQLAIECAAVYDKDKLWLCHGHQSGAHISKVNCEENIMYRLNIELESRVMCMHSLDDDTMLLGTLSHFVHSYSTKSRRLMWELRLNDSVLSLASHEEDGVRQVYAGLADGTVAVIENIEGPSPKPEIFYIMIGSNPVTCLLLVDRRLWCGTGNRVVILNARTLDCVDGVCASSSPLDYVCLLARDERGVWLALRGSSVLQLWCPRQLAARLLFDVRTATYPRAPKGGDEEGASGCRITALLPFNGSVLVGTAEGSLIIYDLATRLSRSPSANDFANTPTPSPNEQAHSKIQQLLTEKQSNSKREGRVRQDSGCYSTPCPTPQPPTHQTSSVPMPLASSEERQDEGSSPDEDRSEATSHSTIKVAGRSSVTSPDLSAHTMSDHEDKKAEVDSGHSSLAPAKRPCTCSKGSSVRCRHCLLEASAALRKLFDQYSLSKHHTARYRAGPGGRRERLSSDGSNVPSIGGRNDSKSTDDCGWSDSSTDFAADRSADDRANSTAATHHHTLDPEGISQMGKSSVILRAVSADDVTQWVKSQESSDSYDFDDVFVTHDEDTSTRPTPLPARRRSSNILDYALLEEKCSSSLSQRTDSWLSDVRSSWVAGKDVRSQLPAWDGVTTSDGPHDDVSVSSVRSASRDLLQLSEWSTGKSSETASNVSFSSTDVPYAFELHLQEKIKISDKPIKCLLETRCGAEPTIISCAGCYGDDEAVLKWIKVGDEDLWTNDPIIEVCPYTNAIKPSQYARSRLPRRTSSLLSMGCETESPARSSSVASTSSSAGSVVNSGLARVHNIFLRVHDKA